MALTNEDLLAISQLSDTKSDAKLEPLKVDIQCLAENHVPAAKKYEKTVPRIESIQAGAELLKKVVTEHSEKLQKIS